MCEGQARDTDPTDDVEVAMRNHAEIRDQNYTSEQLGVYFHNMTCMEFPSLPGHASELDAN